MKRAITSLCVVYLLSLLIGWILLHSAANEWWPLTLFLFSPRWVLALPLVVLIPATLYCRWGLTWVYLLHGLLILFPLMGYQLERWVPPVEDGRSVLRVLSCNVGGGELDTDKLVDLIRQHSIEVVMLQECTAGTSRDLFSKLGWQHRQKHNISIGSPHVLGEGTVLAKQPKSHYNVTAALSCELQHDDLGTVELVSTHLPTFRPAFEKLRRLDVREGRDAMSDRAELYRLVASEVHEGLKQWNRPLVLAGDFNMPVESVYYKEFWRDKRNAFSEAGHGLGFTKFTRVHAVRIDHVLIDDSWTVLGCWIGPDLGGDHRPVMTELAVKPSIDPNRNALNVRQGETQRRSTATAGDG